MSQCEEVHCRKYSSTFIAGNTDGSHPSSFHDLENSCSQSLMLGRFLLKKMPRRITILPSHLGTTVPCFRIYISILIFIHYDTGRVFKFPHFVSVLSSVNLAKKNTLWTSERRHST